MYLLPKFVSICYQFFSKKKKLNAKKIYQKTNTKFRYLLVIAYLLTRNIFLGCWLYTLDVVAVYKYLFSITFGFVDCGRYFKPCLGNWKLCFSFTVFRVKLFCNITDVFCCLYIGFQPPLLPPAWRGRQWGSFCPQIWVLYWG